MIVVFWSPTKGGQTARNMSILANILRIQYRKKVHTFHDYQKIILRIEKLEKDEYEDIFLDCANHMDSFVRELMQCADIVIINLPQSEKMIAAYFEKRYKIKGKVFYLINNNPINLINSERMCKNIFRLKEEESGIIPYNLRFEQYYEKRKGFLYQKELLERDNYGIEREFEEKTCEFAVKLLKMNCLLKKDAIYYSICKGE